MTYVIATRDGDDCQLHDERNRVLVNVPVELLVRAEPMPEQPPKCWREVDELEIF